MKTSKEYFEKVRKLSDEFWALVIENIEKSKDEYQTALNEFIENKIKNESNPLVVAAFFKSILDFAIINLDCASSYVHKHYTLGEINSFVDNYNKEWEGTVDKDFYGEKPISNLN